MNINRNNYEEFFLLYIDNELSAQEKNKVDAFIASNPDLKEELVMLQQSVLKPAEMDFPAKEQLLKPETIDAATEEKLLLLLDNELQQNEIDALLLSLENNERQKQEWSILEQTKLSPSDVIVFKEKAALYRREQGKVISIKWWRVAAAAMLIGIGLWGTVNYINNSTMVITIVANNGNETKKETGIIVNNNPVVEKNNHVLQMEKPATNATATPQPDINAGTVTNRKKSNSIPTVIDNAITQNDTNNNDALPVVKNKQEQTPHLSESINNNSSNEKVYVNVTPETQNNKLSNTNTIPAVSNNNMAINTSFNNNTGDNNTFAFEDDEDKPRKTRLGGFFKRVKRVIERKTKIKTGDADEVRIANMSFAMH